MRPLWWQLVRQFWPQVFDQLTHRIGDGFCALELKDFLVYPLDFVGRYDSAVEHARLIDAALFDHSRRPAISAVPE